MNEINAKPVTFNYLKTIGEFVAEDYRTAQVFENNGIDFCCGGQVTLADTCKKKGLDLAALVTKIEEVKNEPIKRSENYTAWSLAFLIDYIVNTHHEYLYKEMELIVAYTQKISEVHSGHHPELMEIARIFDKTAADMLIHLREEEETLFPAIKRMETAKKSGHLPTEKDRRTLNSSLEKLHLEHEEIGDATHRIRRLATDYKTPADACNTFVVTYNKLSEFEEDLHKHVHLENNILFLKAAQLALNQGGLL